MRIRSRWPFVAAISVAALICVAGCDDTAAGASKDTQEISRDVKKGAEEAGERTAEATSDAVAATVLTPKIKGAIVANPLLNDPANRIDVESDDESVKLTGFVKTNEMKRTAGEIAQRILDEANAKQSLRNELVVRP